MPEPQTRATAAAGRLTEITDEILAEVQQLPAELDPLGPRGRRLDGHGQPLSHPGVRAVLDRRDAAHRAPAGRALGPRPHRYRSPGGGHEHRGAHARRRRRRHPRGGAPIRRDAEDAERRGPRRRSDEQEPALGCEAGLVRGRRAAGTPRREAPRADSSQRRRQFDRGAARRREDSHYWRWPGGAVLRLPDGRARMPGTTSACTNAIPKAPRTAGDWCSPTWRLSFVREIAPRSTTRSRAGRWSSTTWRSCTRAARAPWPATPSIAWRGSICWRRCTVIAARRASASSSTGGATTSTELADADLIVAADGANSAIRTPLSRAVRADARRTAEPAGVVRDDTALRAAVADFPADTRTA